MRAKFTTGWMAAGVGLTLLLSGGCKNSSSPMETAEVVEELAQVSFALELDVDSPTCPHTLEYPSIKSMRLRILDGTVDDLETAVVRFDTSSPDIAPDGCLSFVQCGGADVRMDAWTPPRTRSESRRVGGRWRIGSCHSNCRAGAEIIQRKCHSVSGTLQRGRLRGGFRRIRQHAIRDSDSEGRAAGNSHDSPVQGTLHILASPSRDNVTFLRELALTECSVDCDCVEPFKEILKKECTEEQKEQDVVPGSPVSCVNSRCSSDYGFEALITTECEEDAECSSVHPNAFCGAEGYCDIGSYYPLEPNRPLAFHTASLLSDGGIALVGGFNQESDGAFSASGAAALRFDPYTLTFTEVEEMPWLDEELEAGELDRAFHTALTLDEGEAVVVSGGIGAVELGFETDEEGTRRLAIRPADDEDSEKANFRSNVVLLDGAMKNGTTQARQSGLSVAGEEDVFQGIALQAADLVLNQGQGEYLFASGLAPEGSPATDAGVEVRIRSPSETLQ